MTHEIISPNGASADGSTRTGHGRMAERIGRRTFLQFAATSALSLAFPHRLRSDEEKVAVDRLLARVTEPRVNLHIRPTPDSSIVGERRLDDVLEVSRRVVGRGVYPYNHVWFETTDGFLWSSHAQPVRNRRNPLEQPIPETGMWTELTVPFVDGLERPDPGAAVRYRLYYSMVLNVDQKIEAADGTVYYRVRDENGIIMYSPGDCFRAIQPEEMAPITPDIEDKEIRINLARQDLSGFEAGVEVYYCRISSGYALLEGGVRRWNTPIGQMHIWRKMVSRHMSGGDRVSGYDLPGVGWTILFHGTGAAIHSTYWHNDFGAPRSRGCINVRPEDGKWLFRWSQPVVPARPGDVTLYWPDHGTKVIVTE